MWALVKKSQLPDTLAAIYSNYFVRASSAPGASASFAFSQLRRRVGEWKASVFQKSESWPGPRAARVSSYTALTSGLASSYSVIGTLGIYEPSSCNSSGVESFPLPWHRSPVSCAMTDLVFRYAVKVIVAIIRDHKSVKRGTLVLT